MLLTVIMALTLASCNKVDAEGVWEDATYLNDEEFGDGAKTVTVEVKAGEDSVIFTVNTDKTTLADALTEHGLISGEVSDYGLAVYTVNGMTANWNTDGVYWALYEGDDYASGGVSFIEIKDGDSFRFELSRS